MGDLYGETTESLESLENISCAARVTCGRSTASSSSKQKNVQKDIELTSVEPQQETSELMLPEADENVTTSPKQRFQKFTRGVISAQKLFSDDPERRKLIVDRHKHLLDRFSSTRGAADFSRAAVNTDAITRRGKRDNAAKILFKAGVNKLRTKPKLGKSTLDSFGGRSFVLSDLLDDAGDESGFSVADYTFFDFFTQADIRDELPKPEYHKKEEPDHTSDSEETFARAGLGKFSLRKTKKSRFWIGNLLGGKVKKNVDAKFKSQYEEEREYFTVWLSFVQTVIMIVVLCIYSFAPLGIDVENRKKEVLLSREGITAPEILSRKVVESFWLGPSIEHLILLGAKYSPCMRRDFKVYEHVEAERKLENSTGCCMEALVADGCIQRERKYCLSPHVEFRSGKVCGQDKDLCIKANPPSTKWDPYTITSWPKCEKHIKAEKIPALRHMTCTVTGRPCCINTQGQCVITTEDNCRFWNGIYHRDASLCSQVDCLAATCGNSFYNNDQPDQIYRLFLSLFLCAGILHLVVVLIFNFTLLRYIEGYAGWWRTGLIFIVTGIGGNLWSAILLPYQAEVGESGAMFGIYACLFVQVIQNWQQFTKPLDIFGKLFGILVVMFLFGLLPYVDNTAHIFGFIYGLLFGFVVLPYIPMSQDDDGISREKRIDIIRRVVCFILLFGLFILGFVLFYFQQELNSKAIAIFNCPLGERWCQKFHQGVQLESREIVY